MHLYIKNMVCPRCISAVSNIVTKAGFEMAHIQLGEVVLMKSLTIEQLETFKNDLKVLGFELLDDARQKQIEKIKSIIINHIHYNDDKKFAFADILAHELHKEYSQLSKLFSETEGITIEQYVINQKIEKVKELLVYNELNLNQVAFKLNYSSVAHLSAQFKKVTGITPTQFKAQGISLRKSLDTV